LSLITVEPIGKTRVRGVRQSTIRWMEKSLLIKLCKTQLKDLWHQPLRRRGGERVIPVAVILSSPGNRPTV
jgi:hypothetical protein